jgi:hypothetical protein
VFDIKSWMRKHPKPKRLHIKKPDGEWQFVEITGGKYLWTEIERTIKSSEATAVECLDASGNVLRSVKLTEEDTQDPDDSFDTPAVAADKTLSKALQAQAIMLDAYGRRLNEAYVRGAEAASGSQDKLVQLVENLTQHMTIALTNLHNISTNYANALAQQNDSGTDNGELLKGVLGLALGGGQAQRVPPPDPNGQKGKK